MFAIELADRLGFVHVDEMLAMMTPREFDERYAMELIEPRGRRNTAILQAEIIASVQMLVAVLTATKLDKKSIVSPDDLMPRFKTRRSVPTVTKERASRLAEGFEQVKRGLGF